jgi:hypothetical protein
MHTATEYTTQSLTLFFHALPAQAYRLRSLTSAETTLVITSPKEVPSGGLFIQLTHEQLNTQLDLGGIAPAVILQFDANHRFTGASLSLGTSSGSFGLVTQSKNLVILPFDEHFPIGQLSHFELN